MRTRKLSRAPSLLGLDARAAAAAVPGASRLPFLGGGDDVPDLELVLDDVRVDQEHLARYCRVCGYRPGDELPLTYPHVVAFPLHLALLTHRRFPFSAVGLVHMANEITRRRPIKRGEILCLRVHLTSLEPHPRGQSFQIVTEAGAGGQLVWQERCTIIHRGEDETASDEGSSEDEDAGGEAPADEVWAVPRSTGFRYALASGDHNPIHVHPIAARISGLPGVVAPGMWTKARALASMRDRLPAAATAAVEFRRPIVLPAEAAFVTQSEEGTRGEDGTRAFSVRDPGSGKPYLVGTLRRA